MAARKKPTRKKPATKKAAKKDLRARKASKRKKPVGEQRIYATDAETVSQISATARRIHQLAKSDRPMTLSMLVSVGEWVTPFVIWVQREIASTPTEDRVIFRYPRYGL